MKQCILAGLIILSVAACGGGDGDELSQSSASSSGPLARVSVAEIDGGVGVQSAEMFKEATVDFVEENSDAEVTSTEVIAEAGSSTSKEPPKVWAVDGLVLAKLFDAYSYFISPESVSAKISFARLKENEGTPSGKKYNAIKEVILSRLSDFPTEEHAREYGHKQFIINGIIFEMNETLKKKRRNPLPLSKNNPSMDFKAISFFDSGNKKQELRSAKRLIVLYKNRTAGAGDDFYITKSLRYMEEDDKNLKRRNSSDQKKEKGWYQIDSNRAQEGWRPLNVDNIDDWLHSDENVCEFMYFVEEGLGGVLEGAESLGARLKSEKSKQNNSLKKLVSRNSRIYLNRGASG